MKYIEASDHVLLHTYNRFPLVFKNGKGAYLYDTNNKKYLDFGAGIAVCALGYGNEKFTLAMKEQMEKLLHTSNLYYNENTLSAADGLASISGMDRVFFTNSGTEAIESALKAARKYAYKQKSGKYKFIALENSFHGRSMGALSVTGTKKYRDPFEPLIPGVSFGILNDFKSIEELVDDETCGIIMEPIQGEGGIHESTQEFIEKVRRLCDDKGILLIFDEIQCGMGRTGSYFAWQKYGVKPDIIAIAKAIGNGFPVGAIAMTENVAKFSLEPGDHGTTYGGNALALMAVSKVIEIFKEENLCKHVTEIGAYLKEELLKLSKEKPCIKDVRGCGLIQGIELEKPAAEVIKKALENGLVLIGAGEKVIRFVPPLIIEKEHVDEMISILKEIL